MDHHHDTSGPNRMALSATLHCLTGCAIGEIIGLMVGTAAGFSNTVTIALSITLAFVFGFGLSTLPLVTAGMTLGAALSLVVAADTLSIATMEVVDNLVMALIPGAMDAGLVNPVFWVGMALALTAAFAAAYPVNRYLMNRGKGHALTHEQMGEGISIPPVTLAALIVAFMLGGFVVSVADGLDPGSPHAATEQAGR